MSSHMNRKHLSILTIQNYPEHFKLFSSGCELSIDRERNVGERMARSASSGDVSATNWGGGGRGWVEVDLEVFEESLKSFVVVWKRFWYVDAKFRVALPPPTSLAILDPFPKRLQLLSWLS
ncbi:hypothetical protein PM082_002145 [Marasmius tenuissimus]|nr:hypothetical protein PM082_002145 [Marasmius tenuissimus]